MVCHLNSCPRPDSFQKSVDERCLPSAELDRLASDIEDTIVDAENYALKFLPDYEVRLWALCFRRCGI
jgi:hypothetical protein